MRKIVMALFFLLVGMQAYAAAPTVNGLWPTSGSATGGTKVQITGTGFTNATGVTVAGVPVARFEVYNDQLMYATTAPGTGSGSITVTTPDGVGTSSSGVQFTYYYPTVYITDFEPKRGHEDGGTIVIISGSGFSHVTAVEFGGVNASSFSVDNDTQITAIAPAGTGDVSVSVANPASADTAMTSFSYAGSITPDVTFVSPNNGSISGGNVIEIFGSGFSGATTVTFGGNAATSYSVDSDAKITATVPSGTAGYVDIAVTANGATGTRVNAYRYIAPPTISGIDPSIGATTGGTVVDIRGSNLSYTTAVKFGGVSGANISLKSDDWISVETPAGIAGQVVDVEVIAKGGSATSVGAYTYVLAPVVSSLSPIDGPEGGGTVVTITGTGFTGASEVKFDSSPATTFTVDSDTQITATAPAGTGGRAASVTVIVSGIPSNSGPTFSYIHAPVVVRLFPPNGPEAGGTSVSIEGYGFINVSEVKFGSTSVSFTVGNDSQITATAPAGTGIQPVTVTTPGGTNSAGPAYAYIPEPVVGSLSPTNGAEAGGTVVTITGSNFTGASSVLFGSVPATTFTVDGPTQITATAPAGTGAPTITVTTPGGTSVGGPMFTYMAAPAITSLLPFSGAESGGTAVTITGTSFLTASAVLFGGTAATSFTVDSNTQITAVAPPGTGTVGVSVTTNYGVSGVSNFTYVPAPIVGSLSPDSGPASGGTTVTITGSNFTDASEVKFGSTPATTFTVDGPTQITATAPAGTGSQTVTVTTPGGASSGGPAYAYIPVPIVDSLSPIEGPEAGGTTVTITGSNFTGASSVLFGSVPATTFTVNGSTQITATAPAGTGSQAVTVTATGGTSVGGPTFKYLGPPTITGMSPSGGTEAGGTPITISGVNFTGATAVLFGSTPATHIVVVSDTEITVQSPAGSGAASVTITNGYGTSAGFAYNYTTPGNPTITNVTPSTGSLSGGTQVRISGRGFMGATVVTFGGDAAQGFTVVSDELIIATTPPAMSEGLVEIMIQTPVGSAASGTMFTYAPLRGDPSLDPEVQGLVAAQVSAVERHYRAFATTLETRLSALRSENGFDSRRNSYSFNLGLPGYQGMERRERFMAEHTPGSPELTANVGSLNLAELMSSSTTSSNSANAMLAPPWHKRWAMWVDGAITLGSTDNDLDLDSTTFGMSMGADYAFTDRFIAGLALGYSNDSTDVGSKGTKSESDAYTAALYGSYALSPCLYLQGAVGYSGIDMDSTRYTTTGLATGNRDGSQYFASVLLGWERQLTERFTLSPFGRFEAVKTDLDGFAERGSDDSLRYGKTGVELYAGSVGVRGRYAIPTSWGCLTPSAGMEYTHNLKDTAMTSLGYADTGVMPYSLSATSVGRNTITATAGLEARIRHNMGMSLNYRGSFAKDRDSHNINFQFNLSW